MNSDVFRKAAGLPKGPLAPDPDIYWTAITVEEAKAIYEFAQKKAEQDNVVILMTQQNSVAGVIKIASGMEFFEATKGKRKHYTISEFPFCAEDITDYGSW